MKVVLLHPIVGVMARWLVCAFAFLSFQSIAHAELLGECWQGSPNIESNLAYGKVVLEGFTIGDVAQSKRIAKFSTDVVKSLFQQRQDLLKWMRVEVKDCWTVRLQKDPPRSPASAADFSNDAVGRTNTLRIRIFVWGEFASDSSLELSLAVIPMLRKQTGDGIYSVQSKVGGTTDNVDQSKLEAALRAAPVLLLTSFATVAAILEELEAAPGKRSFDESRGLCWPDQVIKLLGLVDQDLVERSGALSDADKATIRDHATKYRETAKSLAALEPRCPSGTLRRAP